MIKSRFLRVSFAFFLLSSLAGGATLMNPGGQGAEKSTKVAQTLEPISLKNWQPETIIFPPQFAPSLPTGKESLRFAPGWSDPRAEGFWTYAIVMWIDESMPNMKRIDELLETYYTGLLRMFASGQNKDIGSSPVKVVVTRKGKDKYNATMDAVDAFATFKPIRIRFEIVTVALGPKQSSLRIKLSSRPKDHAIWKSLDLAITQIVVENKK